MKPSSKTPKPRSGPGRPPDPELKDRRSEQILAVATRLFAEGGFPGTDLQDVADELEVGKGTLYRYFSSKREMFQAAVDRVMVGIQAAIAQATRGIEDPLDLIAVAVRSYLQFFHDHPEYVELLIQERAEFRDRKKPTYFEHREANRHRWTPMYEMLIKAGRIRDIPPERIMEVMGDLIYGTMFTNYVAGRTRSLVEQADDIVDVLYHGLLTDNERAMRPSPRGPSSQEKPE